MRKLTKITSNTGFTLNIFDFITTIVGLLFFSEKVHEATQTMNSLFNISPLLFSLIKLFAGIWLYLPIKYSALWFFGKRENDKTLVATWPLLCAWFVLIIIYTITVINNVIFILG